MDYLDDRQRRAWDALGQRSRLRWSAEDAEAVRVLLAELRRLGAGA